VSERLQAIWNQKCPVCFHGNVFRRGISMHEACPVCAVKFEREQGFFLGALYVAYGLAVPMLSFFMLIVWLVWHASLGRSFQIAMIVFFPISFWVFRYSRVIWLHLDQLIDPRPKPQDI